jgi:hypothetical protein
MSPSVVKPTLTQARILWWIATTGEEPEMVGGTATWHGGYHSTVCKYGLGRPYLPPTAVAAMIEAGLLDLDSETFDPKVVAFPSRNWTTEQKFLHARLRADNEPTVTKTKRYVRLTDKGRSAARAEVPYPWRTNLNGLTDITHDEAERQWKVEAYRQEQQQNPVAAVSPMIEQTPRTGPLPANVIAGAFGRHR